MQRTGGVDREAAPTRPGGGYRPHLDGLRALAVYLVVAFHSGSGRLVGGFIGVDVFFVLSGYLVTQLLIRDIEAHGRIRFSRFYARRFRRLLPASAVTLVVTAVVYAAVAAPTQAAAAVDAFRASFLYVANWYFIGESADYFGSDVASNPVTHFWSLAVEEQFYLLAPILLAGLFAGTRRFGAKAVRVRQVAVVAAGAASLALALHLRTIDLNRAYYGTDTRAYQLLAGAALALTPGIVSRLARSSWSRWVPIPLLGALLTLTTWVVTVDPVLRGLAATLVTLALLATVEATRGPITRLLSAPGLVYLGSLSYGTYLWHWPVVVVMRELVTVGSVATFAVASFVATGLASVSFHLLERPVRESAPLDRWARPAIATGLAISLVGGIVVVPRLLQTDAADVVASAAGEIEPTPVPALDFANAREDRSGLPDVDFVGNCVGRPVDSCTIVRGSGQHVLVFGDSHANMFFGAFAQVALDNDLTLSTAAIGSCPWQRNIFFDFVAGPDPRKYEACAALSDDIYDRVVPELQPDVIITLSRDYLTFRPGVVVDDAGEPIASSSPAELAALMRTETERSLASLLEVADRVVLVEPLPIAPFDPLACLSEDQGLERCRFVADPDPLPLEAIYRDLAVPGQVWSADFDGLACPFLPVCDPVAGGHIVRYDLQHLTPAFVVSITESLEQALLLSGVLEPG